MRYKLVPREPGSMGQLATTDGGLSTGAMVGIVGGVVLLAGVGGYAVARRKRRRRSGR